MSTSGSSSLHSPNSPLKTFQGAGSRAEIDEFGESPEPSAVINNIHYSEMMQVPKKIHIKGDGNESGEDMSTNSWNSRYNNGYTTEKVDMKVPDRIVVAGQEKHFGAKNIPRELQLESVVMPPDSKTILLQTPPRQIILGQTTPTKAQREMIGYNSEDLLEDETLVVENNRARFLPDPLHHRDSQQVLMMRQRNASSYLEERHGRNYRESSGPDEVMSEVDHLRNEMTRIKDRVVNLEKETTELKEREQYALFVGLFYIAYRALSWLCKTKS